MVRVSQDYRNEYASPQAPNVDASLSYVATRSPVSDPFARYQQVEKMKRAEVIQNAKIYV